MQELVRKINDKLKLSGWYDELRIFLESSDFSDIIVELKKKVEIDRQRFCPGLNNAFRFLEAVQFNKIKLVILIDYSCNRLDQADGIPLSSLDAFYDRSPLSIFKSIDDNHHNVSDWNKQGVLVMPLALTSRIDGKSHKKIWERMIIRIIEVVNKRHSKIPWLLIGADTWKYEDDIASPNQRQMEFKSPMSDTQWPVWVNEKLKQIGKSPISF